MNTYQILKNGVAVTGALTYVEALQKENAFKRADVDNMAAYTLDMFMPNRLVSKVEDVPVESEAVTHMAANVGNAGNAQYAAVCGESDANRKMRTRPREVTCPACLAAMAAESNN